MKKDKKRKPKNKCQQELKKNLNENVFLKNSFKKFLRVLKARKN